MTNTDSLLSISDLSVTFPGTQQPAVRNVSLNVGRGETLGVVGESGSGKSTICLTAMGLQPRGTQVTGSVVFDGAELQGAREAQLRKIRGSRIGLIYQDPMAALNPVRTIGAQMIETLRLHLGMGTREARATAADWLARVGIVDPMDKLRAYPYQFSGGMRQRVVIAMAVSCNPQLIIADEATTALDVLVQEQVLKLLGSLIDELDIALLIVSHDLGVIAGLAQRVVVMRNGEIVEGGDVEKVFTNPQHEYTRTLLDNVRRLEAASSREDRE